MESINNATWKYNLQILEPTSDEFKFVEHFFKTSTIKFLIDHATLNNFQIWRVIEQNTKAKFDEKSNNLMLFHGTSQKSVAGILENGFKNSEEGKFGKGVYMTESSETASIYSCLKFPKNVRFIFVSEVLESQKLETILYSKIVKSRDSPLKNAFSKYMHVRSPAITEDNYKKDHKGRRYRNIAVDENSEYDEFVADSKIVIPRYLVSYENELPIRVM